jgi:hypothetical protein
VLALRFGLDQSGQLGVGLSQVGQGWYVHERPPDGPLGSASLAEWWWPAPRRAVRGDDVRSLVVSSTPAPVAMEAV